MKSFYYLGLCFATFSVISINSCSTATTSQQEAAAAQTITPSYSIAKFSVHQLDCGSNCLAYLQEKLMVLPGIYRAEIIADKGVAQIQFDSNRIEEHELIAAIRNLNRKSKSGNSEIVIERHASPKKANMPETKDDFTTDMYFFDEEESKPFVFPNIFDAFSTYHNS